MILRTELSSLQIPTIPTYGDVFFLLLFFFVCFYNLDFIGNKKDFIFSEGTAGGTVVIQVQ